MPAGVTGAATALQEIFGAVPRRGTEPSRRWLRLVQLDEQGQQFECYLHERQRADLPGAG